MHTFPVLKMLPTVYFSSSSLSKQPQKPRRNARLSMAPSLGKISQFKLTFPLERSWTERERSEKNENLLSGDLVIVVSRGSVKYYNLGNIAEFRRFPSPGKRRA